jgi:hypothetical protein
MNPYAYVGENPETRTDPTGQRSIDGSGDYGSIGPGGSLDLFNPFPYMELAADIMTTGTMAIAIITMMRKWLTSPSRKGMVMGERTL